MSMVDELKAAISDANHVADTREDCDVARFLRDHGKALVEAVEISDELICCTDPGCGCRGATRAEYHAAMKDLARTKAGRETRHELAHVALPSRCAPLAMAARQPGPLHRVWQG